MSIFDKLTAETVLPQPFPLALADDVLPADLLQGMQENLEYFEQWLPGTCKPGEKIYFSLAQTLRAADLPEPFKRFLAENATAGAAKKWLKAFQPSISNHYPALADKLNELRDEEIALRNLTETKQSILLLEVQLCTHAAVAGSDAVADRGPNIKETSKLLIAHLFLPHPQDTQPQGAFQTYGATNTLKFASKQQVWNRAGLMAATAVPYCANKAVYYLNTDKSVQAMIPRSRTPYSLNYMNLTLELRQPLFQLDNLSLRA